MNVWRGKGFIFLVLVMLGAASLACMQTAAGLNEGKGTRQDPVPAREFAKTSNYEVRALSVVRPMEVKSDSPGSEYMRVQFEIKCRKAEDAVCNLGDLRDDLKLVSSDGVLYDPVDGVALSQADKPLEGEILGQATNAGWVVYEVPLGLEVTAGVAAYGQDQRTFFKLP